jgi:GntR family transcriptional regulator, transcriptional repressor for pyruvate dehydrogenase complex
LVAGGPDRWDIGVMGVTDDAIDRIKDMIVSGRLRPGDRLPREADLAAHLGLSRNSLREAVRALSLMRVLDVRQGDGTYVTSLRPGLLLDVLGFVMEVQDEITRLRALLDEVGPDSPADRLAANELAFHRGVAQASGNAVLCSLLENLVAPTIRGGGVRRLAAEGTWPRMDAEHRAILDALADHQPDLARAWATVHVATTEHRLREVLST